MGKFVTLAFAASAGVLFSLDAREALADDASTCGKLLGAYSIIPYHSWGSATDDAKQEWREADCNHKVCRYFAREFDVVPNQSWGSLPPNYKKIWSDPEVSCNDHAK
jgi:hypothetical protein